MTILDKLLEKKDVLAYIEFRIITLKNELKKLILVTPEDDRELLIERFNGRIQELTELKTVVHQGFIKIKSKNYCKNKYIAQER